MSGMDKNYITSVELQSYFVDKTTGAPMSGGYMSCFKDSDRTQGKDVYQKVQNGFDISGNPLYEYVSLGDVVQLSAVGTFMDNSINDIAVYFYPWDADGNLELYYVAVFNADGTPQFTREGWPNSFATDNPDIGGAGALENQISNSQFVTVNFDPSLTLTINLIGNTTTTAQIAPDWNLVIVHTATSTVSVARTAIAGSSNFPTQSPYYMTFTPGANISSMKLVQRLPHNPGLWSPVVAGTRGYIATSVTMGPATPSITVRYEPSTGTAKTLLTAVNASADYVEKRATVQLDPSNNPTTATTGFVSITIDMSVSTATTLSSIQVVSMNVELQNVAYEQNSVNRQIDHLFNYYKDLLYTKPVPSWLVGWDFPMNPTQALGDSVAAQAVGANKSYYAWDQTILFQTTNSGITVSRDTTGALKTLSANAAGTQLALVQYLSAPDAIEMLSRRKCVNISANASVATLATVSLWYTKDVSLPSTIGSNNSIVLTLDADGYPATQNGTWVQVPRSGIGGSATTATATNAARVTIGVAPSGAANFNQYPMTGWDMEGDTDINGATYFAIVVGTASLAQNAYVLWQSISCQDGDIATVPAPKSIAETLLDCQAYYQKSFPQGTVPAYQATSAGAVIYNVQVGGVTGYAVYVKFPAVMIDVPTAKFWSLFSTGAPANATWTNLFGGNPANYFDSGTATTELGTSGFFSISNNGMTISNTQTVNDTLSTYVGVHYTLDARLGQ